MLMIATFALEKSCSFLHKVEYPNIMVVSEPPGKCEIDSEWDDQHDLNPKAISGLQNEADYEFCKSKQYKLYLKQFCLILIVPIVYEVKLKEGNFVVSQIRTVYRQNCETTILRKENKGRLSSKYIANCWLKNLSNLTRRSMATYSVSCLFFTGAV